MRFTPAFVALVAPYFAMAAPLKRQASAADLLVLKFANVLEQLETEFYTQALAKFGESDFITAGFSSAQLAIEQFSSIVGDESAHTSILAATIQALGDQPLTTCKFDFSSVLTSVSVMAPVARLVENVGVGAYLGAAGLVDDPRLLTAAASILTIEARHQTMLNVLNDGTAIPQAFDIPLRPEQVLAIASPFISGCDLGIKGNAPITVGNTGTVTAGTVLQLTSTGTTGQNPASLACQMIAGGLPAAIALPLSNCVVPAGLNGPVAVFITNTTQPLLNNVEDQFASSIIAGPTMLFLDNKPETLGSLVRSGASSASSSIGSSSSGSTGASVVSSNSGSVITPSNVVDPAGTVSPDGAATVLGWVNNPAAPSNLQPVSGANSDVTGATAASSASSVSAVGGSYGSVGASSGVTSTASLTPDTNTGASFTPNTGASSFTPNTGASSFTPNTGASSFTPNTGASSFTPNTGSSSASIAPSNIGTSSSSSSNSVTGASDVIAD